MKVTASWSQWFNTGGRVAEGGVTIRVPERKAFQTVRAQATPFSNLVDGAITILIIINQRFLRIRVVLMNANNV